jgi:type VI secretion system protein ImpM
MADQPGWYGKLPALGDFASRRLSAAWIEAWDAWLQQELVDSRQVLGDDAWLSLYMVAPVRRFWIAPGLLDRAAWLGVLMPSVDSVGRQFPFTLTVALRHGQDHLLDALANDDWFDAADGLARQVLDPAFDVTALESAIAALQPLRGERRVEAHGGASVTRELFARGTPLGSVWWCEGARCADDYLGADTLPRGAAFRDLLGADM